MIGNNASLNVNIATVHNCITRNYVSYARCKYFTKEFEYIYVRIDSLLLAELAFLQNRSLVGVIKICSLYPLVILKSRELCQGHSFIH